MQQRIRIIQIGAVLAVLGAGALIIAGQGKSEHKQAKAEAPKMTEPSERTARILQRIEGYEKWPMFDEYRARAVRSEGHDNMYVVAHYNDVAAPTVREAANGVFPEGSLIVKENRPEPDAAPMAVTTMAKEQDGWYWIKHTPDGQVMVEDGMPLEGRVDGCIGCHSAARENDRVFSGRKK